jgi:hypothetical protein
MLVCKNHAEVIGIFEKDSKALFSVKCPIFCTGSSSKAFHDVYNRKGFLAPTSIRSMASFHAKIFPDGSYMFRIHDCNSGIRLRGDLNRCEEIEEAVQKLISLESEVRKLREHIEKNYTITPFP